MPERDGRAVLLDGEVARHYRDALSGDELGIERPGGELALSGSGRVHPHADHLVPDEATFQVAHELLRAHEVSEIEMEKPPVVIVQRIDDGRPPGEPALTARASPTLVDLSHEGAEGHEREIEVGGAVSREMGASNQPEQPQQRADSPPRSHPPQPFHW